MNNCINNKKIAGINCHIITYDQKIFFSNFYAYPTTLHTFILAANWLSKLLFVHPTSSTNFPVVHVYAYFYMSLYILPNYNQHLIRPSSGIFTQVCRSRVLQVDQLFRDNNQKRRKRKNRRKTMTKRGKRNRKKVVQIVSFGGP